MGELLALGVTHFPALAHEDAHFTAALQWALKDPDLPPSLMGADNWPSEMRSEWSDDCGLAAASRHRAALVAGFGRVRAALEEFAPDAVVIIGDDQYENFREDVIPPFAMLAYADIETRPWSRGGIGLMPDTNVWQEDPSLVRVVRGQPEIARHLTEALIARDIDIAYAYQPLHHPDLPHAFMNTVLFFDYERRGFSLPIIPLSVNCYGRRVIAFHGGIARFGDGTQPDPPSPRPSRVMQLGAALADAVLASPWRIAVVASSSWSHAFLCDHTHRLRPDTPADHRLYEAFVGANWDVWRGTVLTDIEYSGQQEALNWFALAGAVEYSGATLAWSTFVETAIFNSNKVFAIFNPVSR